MNCAYPLSIKDILQDLVNSAGISEAELARKINIPTATLNKLKTGRITDPRSSTLMTIANYFGLSIDQLLGHSPIEKSFSKSSMHVPLLENDQILSTDISQLNYANYNSWVSFDATNEFHNHKMFAINIEGDAMSPYFETNTAIIIDCDRPAKNQNFVLAYIAASSELLVRQILIDGNSKVLKPMNAMFNPILLNENDHVVGVVVHSIRKHL